MTHQVFYGSVSLSKSNDGATTTLRIITPHVDCPSPQEVYELALPQALLEELVDFPSGRWATAECVSVKHIDEDDAPSIPEKDQEPNGRYKRQKV